jgi:hypothetical protein
MDNLVKVGISWITIILFGKCFFFSVTQQWVGVGRIELPLIFLFICEPKFGRRTVLGLRSMLYFDWLRRARIDYARAYSVIMSTSVCS